MAVTDEGMAKEAKELHPSKVRSRIQVKVSGSSTLANEMQFLKAAASISITELGMETLTKALQSANA